MSSTRNPETGEYEVFNAQAGGLEPTGQDTWHCSCGRWRLVKERYRDALEHQRRYHNEGSTYRDALGFIHWR